jgi:MFS family permease
MLGANTFRSLRHANYRLFYFGQLISLTGTWMQNVAQAWLVYRLTESSFMLGLVTAASQLPVLIFGLYTGILADRFSRYRLFVTAQVLAMFQATMLGVLTLGGWVQPWQILILALLLGLVHALEMPVRHAFVAQLVPYEDLPNAIALNSSQFHLARFFGPAIAGWLVAVMGEGPVFFINAVTFFAVVFAVLAMRLPAHKKVDRLHTKTKELQDGLRFAWSQQSIRGALVMVGTISLVGTSAAVLMPVFAAQVFHSGPQSLGLLLGVTGIGSLVGALTLARRGNVTGIENIISLAGIMGGFSLLVFASINIFWLAMLVLPVLGFSLTTLVASSNAYIQLNVPDHLRGRVMSIFTVTFHGIMPVGAFLVGLAGEYAGAPVTVTGCGVLLFSTTLIFTWVVQKGSRPA